MTKLSPACCRTRGGLLVDLSIRLLSRHGGKICPPNIQLALHLSSPGAWRSNIPRLLSITFLLQESPLGPLLDQSGKQSGQPYYVLYE